MWVFEHRDVFRLNRQNVKLQWSDRTELFQSISIGHCSFVYKRRKTKKQLSVSSYEDLTVMGNEGWPACAPAFLLPSREWRIRTPFWKQHGRKSLFFPFSWQDVHINRTVFWLQQKLLPDEKKIKIGRLANLYTFLSHWVVCFYFCSMLGFP